MGESISARTQVPASTSIPRARDVQPALTDGPTQAAEMVSLMSFKATGEDDYVSSSCGIGLTRKLVSARGKGIRTVEYVFSGFAGLRGELPWRHKYSVNVKRVDFSIITLLKEI